MKPSEECFSVTAAPGFGGAETLRPEINLKPTDTNGRPDDQIINCGYVPMVIQKMFGPLIFCDLRVRAEAKTCTWIIEVRDEGEGEWLERARIPGQTPD